MKTRLLMIRMSDGRLILTKDIGRQTGPGAVNEALRFAGEYGYDPSKYSVWSIQVGGWRLTVIPVA